MRKAEGCLWSLAPREDEIQPAQNLAFECDERKKQREQGHKQGNRCLLEVAARYRLEREKQRRQPREDREWCSEDAKKEARLIVRHRQSFDISPPNVGISSGRRPSAACRSWASAFLTCAAGSSATHQEICPPRYLPPSRRAA